MTPTVFTEKIQESKNFYEDCFGAKTLLDCGWYLHLKLDIPGEPELCFIKPNDQRPAFRGGLTLNLPCENIDAEWERLKALGCSMENPPADHPWGDRSFTLFDPNGVVLYCYTPIPPSPEFQ